MKKRRVTLRGHLTDILKPPFYSSFRIVKWVQVAGTLLVESLLIWQYEIICILVSLCRGALVVESGVIIGLVIVEKLLYN